MLNTKSVASALMLAVAAVGTAVVTFDARPALADASVMVGGAAMLPIVVLAGSVSETF